MLVLAVAPCPVALKLPTPSPLADLLHRSGPAPAIRLTQLLPVGLRRRSGLPRAIPPIRLPLVASLLPSGPAPAIRLTQFPREVRLPVSGPAPGTPPIRSSFHLKVGVAAKEKGNLPC